MKELIIIPDVHGRTFWKEAVEDLQPNQKVIFLGDEHDPYPAEGISLEDSINNLKKIIQFKKDHMDQVVLLWGNHAYHYLYPEINGSRKDFEHYELLHQLYTENSDLYEFIHIEEREDKTLVFSHAGVHLEWLCSTTYNLPETSEEFIEVIKNLKLDINNLWTISYLRGGKEVTGSCIWSDIREWLRVPYFKAWVPREYEGTTYNEEVVYKHYPFNDVFQIFGHTQLNNYILCDNFACLDCHRAFKYTDKLRELDGTELQNIKFRKVSQ